MGDPVVTGMDVTYNAIGIREDLENVIEQMHEQKDEVVEYPSYVRRVGSGWLACLMARLGNFGCLCGLFVCLFVCQVFQLL